MPGEPTGRQGRALRRPAPEGTGELRRRGVPSSHTPSRRGTIAALRHLRGRDLSTPRTTALLAVKPAALWPTTCYAAAGRRQVHLGRHRGRFRSGLRRRRFLGVKRSGDADRQQDGGDTRDLFRSSHVTIIDQARGWQPAAGGWPLPSRELGDRVNNSQPPTASCQPRAARPPPYRSIAITSCASTDGTVTMSTPLSPGASSVRGVVLAVSS